MSDALLPTILVVTIVKNDLNGLKKTLESVRSQNYSKYIHFVIDGDSGSVITEFLRETARTYPQLQWISEPDTGIYGAMNKWDQFEGNANLVCWLNAGDLLSSQDVLQKVLTVFIDNNECQWVYGNSRIVDVTGRPIPGIRMTPFNLGLFVLGIKWIPHASTFMKTDFVKKLGFYKEDIGVGADQEFLMRATRFSIPCTSEDNFSIVEAGGTHETLHGVRRERDWQLYRSLNGYLFRNSKMLDTVLFPLIMTYRKLPFKLKSVLHSLSPR